MFASHEMTHRPDYARDFIGYSYNDRGDRIAIIKYHTGLLKTTKKKPIQIELTKPALKRRIYIMKNEKQFCGLEKSILAHWPKI